jgi:hypothetical protein
MSKWKHIRIISPDRVKIDPSLIEGTKIIINDEEFCMVRGDIDTQVENIDFLLYKLGITDIEVDCVGFGMEFYYRLKELQENNIQ